MSNRKGIVLAGGSGTRLYPATIGISKQLLPIFDKPMIYYPMSVLMLAGMRDILVISTPRDIPLFMELLGSGENLGINISYKIQETPGGLAQALTIGSEFIGDNPSALILGDNIFYGDGFSAQLQKAEQKSSGATIFAYKVHDPQRYGIVEFNRSGHVMSLEEKPLVPRSNYAVTGLYFYDKYAPLFAKELTPSARGELEITDLNKVYLSKSELSVEILSRGHAWLDTGTHESLLEASQFIATIEHRQGLKIGCLEEIAWRKGWISDTKVEHLASTMKQNQYGQYLMRLIKEGLHV